MKTDNVPVAAEPPELAEARSISESDLTEIERERLAHVRTIREANEIRKALANALAQVSALNDRLLSMQEGQIHQSILARLDAKT